ncbi:non-homologous end-joining factor 1 isoform X1 [Girardinichthys multiradiatus]|uniref:non-homologous end-joining factor 1 isoform X1 n=2 Tax=Girardinichthys multiradiatus TaxID=208333 RepID=UPI001FAD9A71|nr:non-homologous end-joining factor 1 isoform X1 [Girardinichthys multiradiatus]
MNPRTDPAEDVLHQHPWRPVTIDGCQLLVKSWFGETAYRILLTDMQCVWEERMDAVAIESRAQGLNRRLRASVRAFFSHLCEVAQPCLSGGGRTGDKAQISVRRWEDGNITLRLKSELAGLPFYWEFHCSPAPVALVCVQLVRPLLAMSRLLQRQVEHLEDLLVRKDEEIQDYRENGATLSRERLQTDIFDKQPYAEDFIEKTLPLLWSEPSDALGFNADLQQLHATIVAYRSARKRKRPEETGAEQNQPLPEPSAQTLTPDGDDPTRDEGNQNSSKQVEPSEARRPAAQTKQPAPITTCPVERPTSKPKKKKVGLFK